VEGVLVLPILVALRASRVAIASPSDPVYAATKKMRELRVNSVIVVTGNKIQGILTYLSFLPGFFFTQLFLEHF
jgi:CBS domain-containing protein